MDQQRSFVWFIVSTLSLVRSCIDMVGQHKGWCLSHDKPAIISESSVLRPGWSGRRLVKTESSSSTIRTTTLLHPFSGLFSRTTWVSWHQKGKPFWILLEQEMVGWQWHQLDHMQIICTSLQTHYHASTSSFSFYRPDALSAAQLTESKHCRHVLFVTNANYLVIMLKLLIC